MDGVDELAERLNFAARAPFLFVGAGMSMRYLGTDGWVNLLRSMSLLSGHPYPYYATKASNELPAVASAIAEDFHERWWNDAAFEASRDEFGERLVTKEGPLKVEVAKHISTSSRQLSSAGTVEATELNLLRQAVIDGVVTTNYDTLLEQVFPGFRVFVGQDELLFSDTQGIGEIYKIHGSVEQPESLVLTASDYERFEDKNPYLAAKLLAIFVEHPVIFLGYALNDGDVTDILISVARALTTANLSRLQDHLIFVQWSKSAKEPQLVSTQIAASGYTIPVMQLTVPNFEALFEALTRLPRRFSARLLRQLKEHVYELVMSNDPQSKLYVVDIDDDVETAKDLDVVFGVGIENRLSGRGYVGLSRLDLLKDVLRSESIYEPARMVDEAFPKLVVGHTYIPIFRYLRAAGRLRDDGSLAPDVSVAARVAERVQDGRKRFKPGAQERSRAQRLAAGANNDFKTLAATRALNEVLLGLLCLPEPGMPLDQLRGYLEEHVDALNTNLGSSWSRAVCLYDFLRYAAIPPRRPARTGIVER